MEGSTRRKTPNQGFMFVVVTSLIIHLGVIGAVAWAQGRKPRLDITRNSIPVQLVQLGKKRDPKLLPRKVVEVAEQRPEEGIVLDTGDKTKESAKPADKKEKKLSDAAKRLLEGTSTDRKLEDALSKIEDREGDPEGDIHGTTTDPTNAAKGYSLAVMKVLQQSYRLPDTIPQAARPFLKAEVLLFVEPDGRISRFEFTEKHPNETFMGALDAMLRTVKLPPPPPGEAAALREVGLLVRFKPK